MRMFRMVLCPVLLLALFAAPAAFGQCYDTGINAKAVQKMIDAQDVAALDKALYRVGSKDVAVVAVYRNRRLALNPGEAEETKFLRSLPKTAADMKRVELLTQTADLCELPEISQTVYGMFNTAAGIVQKQGKSYGALIKAAALTEGAMADSAWPAVDMLLQSNTKATLTALRNLPEKDRMTICHGKDPWKLNEQGAREECRSGL